MHAQREVCNVIFCYAASGCSATFRKTISGSHRGLCSRFASKFLQKRLEQVQRSSACTKQKKAAARLFFVATAQRACATDCVPGILQADFCVEVPTDKLGASQKTGAMLHSARRCASSCATRKALPPGGAFVSQSGENRVFASQFPPLKTRWHMSCIACSLPRGGPRHEQRKRTGTSQRVTMQIVCGGVGGGVGFVECFFYCQERGVDFFRCLRVPKFVIPGGTVAFS